VALRPVLFDVDHIQVSYPTDKYDNVKSSFIGNEKVCTDQFSTLTNIAGNIDKQGITGLRGQKVRGEVKWNECIKIDMKRLGLVKDDAHNRDK